MKCVVGLGMKGGEHPDVVKAKGDSHPITGHEGPEGEQMCSSTLPSTSVLDSGGWSLPHPGHFTPGKDPVPIV